MPFWSKLMEQVIGGLKDEKISLSLLGIMVLIAWYSFTWANEQHGDLVKRSEFDELSKLMIEHTEEFRIVNASQIIRDFELQLQVAEATGRSQAEIIHIEEEIAQAKRYRSCLIDRRPNCKHLKPPE